VAFDSNYHWVLLDVGAVPVPLGQPPEKSSESDRGRLLQFRNPLLLLLGLVGVLDDGVAVERGAVVHLQDGGELVGVDLEKRSILKKAQLRRKSKETLRKGKAH